MDLSELLNSPQGQAVIRNLSGKLGVGEDKAAEVVNLAVPTILAGMTRNALTPQGAESLNNALETKHDGSLLDNIAGMFADHQDELEQDGQGILGHIFGNKKEVVEESLSKKTGLSIGEIGPLLAILAPVVMSFIGKEKRNTSTGAGGLGDLLGGLLGNSKSSAVQQGGGGIMDIVSGFLDKDKDGNVLDDIMGMFGGRK